MSAPVPALPPSIPACTDLPRLGLDYFRSFTHEIFGDHLHTSNNEKELPDAFLRRCFFHYIKFPDRDTMQRIVDVHFPGIKKALLTEALEVFFGLREIPGLKKKPSTSELIDWLKLLVAEEIPVEALRSPDQKASIPPLHGALLKNEQDMHLFERLVFMAQRNR